MVIGYNHMSFHNGNEWSYTSATIGPLVVSLTGAQAYEFAMASQNTGDTAFGSNTDGYTVNNGFIVEAFL